nr:hypothetical protein Iba_chr10dCG7400 [Ipomoea batatas]
MPLCINKDLFLTLKTNDLRVAVRLQRMINKSSNSPTLCCINHITIIQSKEVTASNSHLLIIEFPYIRYTGTNKFSNIFNHKVLSLNWLQGYKTPVMYLTTLKTQTLFPCLYLSCFQKISTLCSSKKVTHLNPVSSG